MKKTFIVLLSALFLTACTPGVGIGLPLGPVGFVGVGVNKNGVHPTAGVRAGPVGVGVSGQ
ncbi:MAG: hypothetical protein U9O64_01010 [Campylobacterota bacterium]|nr:hypothetical protein [Campylobacterota bacterium]